MNKIDMNNIEKLSIDTIRVLSAEMVEKAQSGHPGTPVGAAPIAYSLWKNHINFTHNDRDWINRDRFVLSAGHASPLLYSLLHLFKFDLDMEDIKNFRQLNSRTPGHPEYGYTDGVEATTGPLGAGLTMGVGMAIAQKHMASVFNTAKFEVFNNHTFVLLGDGCVMEGITSEASSLAGTMNLDNLVVLYDSNEITIDGGTDLSFKENVLKRYEAYGFDTYLVEDANDYVAVSETIEKAKNSDKPAFIEIRSKIGYGSLQEGNEASHGSPLGIESINHLKKNLQYPELDTFEVHDKVYEHFESLVQLKEKEYQKWLKLFKEYEKEEVELFSKLTNYYEDIELEDVLEIEGLFEFDANDDATRNSSGIVLNKLKDHYQNLIGGSADLASSNKTLMTGEGRFNPENYANRNIYFGIRELAMTGIVNGILLHGGLKAYSATFFVFFDFMKPMFRLSSLMKIPQIAVLTHDSIGVGEDGPTHQPIEQLSVIRSTPNAIAFRPADAVETAYGWAHALSSKTTPHALVLSRQKLPQLEGSNENALKGGYVIYETDDKPELLMIASGSEVSLAIESAKELEKEDYSIRVVSMPSQDLFEMQDSSYKESVLPQSIDKRVIIEAASIIPWYRYGTIKTRYITMDTFGESAPAKDLFDRFGFTVDNVVTKSKEVL